MMRKGVWTIFVLLVLYPLSMGPAIWLVLRLEPEDDGFATQTFHTLYDPLSWVAAHTGTSRWLVEYGNLFVGHEKD